MKKQKNHIWTLACALVSLLLTVANLPGAIDIRGFEVTPTVLFKAGTDGLQQRLDVTLDNSGSGESGLLRVRLNGRDLTQTIGPIQPGKGTYAAYIPEITKPVELQFMLQAGNREWKKRLKLFPQRKWTVYLFHHSHTDLGYTDLQNRVRRKHAEYLDQVIHYCRETENYPDDARFRWNCEVELGAGKLYPAAVGIPGARIDRSHPPGPGRGVRHVSECLRHVCPRRADPFHRPGEGARPALRFRCPRGDERRCHRFQLGDSPNSQPVRHPLFRHRHQ